MAKRNFQTIIFNNILLCRIVNVPEQTATSTSLFFLSLLIRISGEDITRRSIHLAGARDVQWNPEGRPAG